METYFKTTFPSIIDTADKSVEEMKETMGKAIKLLEEAKDNLTEFNKTVIIEKWYKASELYFSYFNLKVEKEQSDPIDSMISNYP